MYKVFTSPNLSEAQTIKNVLDIHGIPTTIRNEYLAPIGTIRIGSWPEVWILKEIQFEEARDIVQDYVRNNKFPT